MSRRDEIIKQVYASSKLEKSGFSEVDMARIGEGFDAALEEVRKWAQTHYITDDLGCTRIYKVEMVQFLDSLTEVKK